MTAVRRVGVSAAVCALFLTVALPVAAQLTTGSIAGTVKDAQGGVIPGASITLISESRGTRSIPVTTDAKRFSDTSRPCVWTTSHLTR